MWSNSSGYICWFNFVFKVFHLYEPVLSDIDAPIENEAYFRAVDRAAAEEILRDRIDGSCLVRPYKQKVRNSSDSLNLIKTNLIALVSLIWFLNI